MPEPMIPGVLPWAVAIPVKTGSPLTPKRIPMHELVNEQFPISVYKEHWVTFAYF